ILIAWVMSYAAFGGIAVALIYMLFSPVDHGAREVSRLSSSNLRVSETNERQMWRIGSDLHEGPVQRVALALLKLGSIRDLLAKLNGAMLAQAKELESIRGALNEAPTEMRGMSAGFVPPQVEHLSLADTVCMAVQRHDARTCAAVPLQHRTLARRHFL